MYQVPCLSLYIFSELVTNSVDFDASFWTKADLVSFNAEALSADNARFFRILQKEMHIPIKLWFSKKLYSLHVTS